MRLDESGIEFDSLCAHTTYSGVSGPRPDPRAAHARVRGAWRMHGRVRVMQGAGDACAGNAARIRREQVLGKCVENVEDALVDRHDRGRVQGVEPREDQLPRHGRLERRPNHRPLAATCEPAPLKKKSRATEWT